MELEHLEQQYWKEEEKLQAIASSFGVSVKQLTGDIESYDQGIREVITPILYEQIDLLQKILSSKRALISSSPVVSLSSYRALKA